MSADLPDFTSDMLQRFMTDDALPLLVYFHAPGCRPCTLMTPIIERLVKKLRGTVCCAKINARQECELAAAYGVSSVPTSILFKSGYETKRFSGAMDIKSLTAWIME
jgi:thioredoxin-like negative regulator of GroEL